MTRAAPRQRRVEPGPGQESVWDYPRPPRVEPSTRHVRIEHAGTVIAESRRAIRVLETAGAPVWYLPPEDVRTELLEAAAGETVCEWKGTASYFHVRVGDELARRAAFTYRTPSAGYEAIAGYIGFYASRVDRATVDGETVRPQPGGFYAGWITDEIVGPIKGEPGSEGW